MIHDVIWGEKASSYSLITFYCDLQLLGRKVHPLKWLETCYCTIKRLFYQYLASIRHFRCFYAFDWGQLDAMFDFIFRLNLLFSIFLFLYWSIVVRFGWNFSGIFIIYRYFLELPLPRLNNIVINFRISTLLLLFLYLLRLDLYLSLSDFRFNLW